MPGTAGRSPWPATKVIADGRGPPAAGHRPGPGFLSDRFHARCPAPGGTLLAGRGAGMVLLVRRLHLLEHLVDGLLAEQNGLQPVGQRAVGIGAVTFSSTANFVAALTSICALSTAAQLLGSTLAGATSVMIGKIPDPAGSSAISGRSAA